MEASLAERERAANQERPQPLVNLSEERLRERFKGSIVLDKVGPWCPGTRNWGKRSQRRGERQQGRLSGPVCSRGGVTRLGRPR
jgi:hypothetical protein